MPRLGLGIHEFRERGRALSGKLVDGRAKHDHDEAV
jgi:hypothetical protein